MSKPLTSKRTPRSRPYRSVVRSENLASTRERILKAARVEMVAKGPKHFSVPDVAGRAQIALRTIYRHFPTRDALVDAMWLDAYRDFDWILDAKTARELGQAVMTSFSECDRNAALLRASVVCERNEMLRQKTRPARMQKLSRLLSREMAGLSPTARKRALAAIHLLIIPRAWDVMTKSWVEDGAEAGRASAWAVETLIDKIRTDPESLGK